jgi:uncharacterized membrane protein YkvA (DUF1232 family)
MLWGIVRLLSFTRVPRLVIGLMMDRRVPIRLKLVLPAAIAYIVSPVDLAPDFLGALGRIDDLVVAFLAVAIFLALAPREVVAEHLRGAGPGASGGRSVDEERGQKPEVIEGSYRFTDDDSDTRR